MGCKQYAYPLISAAQRLIKVATDAAEVGSKALVISSHGKKSGRDASPLAMATRWR